MGGFRSGFGTATVLLCGFFACISGSDAAGAASVAVLTTILIGLFLRTITMADFPKMLASSAKVNGVIVPIIAF